MTVSDWVEAMTRVIDSLAWPLVAVVLATSFRASLMGILSAIRDRLGDPQQAASLRAGPVALGLDAQQQPAPEAVDSEAADPDRPLTDEQLARVVAALERGVADRSQRQAELLNLLGSAERKATLWYFEYLTFFLAAHTKAILEWIATRGIPISRAGFHLTWTSPVPEADERELVLSVLRQSQLIVDDGDLLIVSERGRQFVDYSRSKVSAASTGTGEWRSVTQRSDALERAKVVPYLAYGVGLTEGDEVEAMIGGVSCGKIVANASGQWVLSIGEDASCSPTDGAEISFTVNGETRSATETWRSAGTPSDIAAGIDLAHDPTGR